MNDGHAIKRLIEDVGKEFYPLAADAELPMHMDGRIGALSRL